MSASQAGRPSRLWVVCPVYFDVPSWSILHQRLGAALDADPKLRDLERRFVLLDDSAGSDPEIDRISTQDGVTIVTPPRNLGNQLAIVRALREVADDLADDDLLITMDADGEDSPEDVPRLLREVGPSQADPMRMALAKRIGRRRGALSMQLFYPLYRLLFALLTGVTTATGNFAGFRGATAKAMLDDPAFDRVYSASLISNHRLVRSYVPSRKGERYEGKPKISFAKHCRQAVAMLVPFRSRVTDRLTVAAVASITLIGLLMRIPAIGDSLFGDELSTYFIVEGHGFRYAMAIVRGAQEATPPLYFAVAWLFAQFGSAPDLLRVPSLIAGIVTIPLTYLLGVRTVGRGPGLVGAALVALSPMMIYYSTEARAYSLEACLVIGSTIALVSALKAPSSSIWRWGLYAVLIALAMYTHYTAVFVLAAQTAWALVAWKGRRIPLLGSVLAAVLLFAPWLPTYVIDSSSPGALLAEHRYPFGARVFVDFTGYWAFSHSQVPIRDIPGFPVAIAFVFGVALAGVDRIVRGMSRPSRDQALILLIALAAPAGAALYSLFNPTVYLPRNLIASWPGFALLVGSIVCAARPRLRPIAIGLVLVAVAVGGVRSISHDQRRPDYDSIVSFLQRNGEPGDPVVDLPSITSGALQSLDVELASSGVDEGSGGFPVLRFGLPTIADLTRNGRLPGTIGVIPYPDPARQAARAAAESRSGRFFLVLRSGGAPDRLGKGDSFDAPLVRKFLSGVPQGWRIVRFLRIPAMQDLEPSVYEFRRRAASN